MFRRYIQSQERVLARKHEDVKAVDGFQWGFEQLGLPRATDDPLTEMKRYVTQQITSSDEFFAVPTVRDYQFDGDTLTYSSPITTETEENNCVYGKLLENGSRDTVVLLLPHWNAKAASYDKLARNLLRFGFPSLRVTLPYHDHRRPPSMQYAEHMVSANLGRTIRSSRQAVLDARAAANCLEERGYRRFAVLGISIGSSIASMLAAHDPRFDVICLALIASNFGEVVWTGTATRHIRTAIEQRVSLEDIRQIWSIISPITYPEKLLDRPARQLVLTGKYDRVFVPHLTQEMLNRCEELKIATQTHRLGCGHYTIGGFPYKYVFFWYLIRFLRGHFRS